MYEELTDAELDSAIEFQNRELKTHLALAEEKARRAQAALEVLKKKNRRKAEDEKAAPLVEECGASSHA